MCSDRFPKRYKPTIATEALSWNLVVPIVQTVTRPSTSHPPPCLVDPMAFLSATLRHLYPVCKALSCPSSALVDDDIVEGLDRSSLTLAEACVVTCADGYTAAGDTETTLTCVLNPELQSLFMRVGAGRPGTVMSFHSK